MVWLCHSTEEGVTRSLYRRRCHYITLQKNVSLYHSTKEGVTISLYRRCDYITLQKKMWLYHSTEEGVTISLYRRRCHYITLQKKVSLYHSTEELRCDYISGVPRVPHYHINFVARRCRFSQPITQIYRLTVWKLCRRKLMFILLLFSFFFFLFFLKKSHVLSTLNSFYCSIKKKFFLHP